MVMDINSARVSHCRLCWSVDAKGFEVYVEYCWSRYVCVCTWNLFMIMSNWSLLCGLVTNTTSSRSATPRVVHITSDHFRPGSPSFSTNRDLINAQPHFQPSSLATTMWWLSWLMADMANKVFCWRVQCIESWVCHRSWASAKILD